MRPPSAKLIDKWGHAEMWRVFDFDHDTMSLMEKFISEYKVECGYKITGKG